MKTKGVIIGICLFLVAFVACRKDNGNDGGNNGNGGYQTEGSLSGIFSIGNGFGRYWSSTYVEKACGLFFHQGDVRAEGADYHSGFAVGLVSDVK